MHTGTKTLIFWRHILWSDETKIEPFGHNDHRYIWRKKGEACKPENTIPTVKYTGVTASCCGECFAAGGTGALHKLCGNIEATSQDISQEVKAWMQMGLSNGQ